MEKLNLELTEVDRQTFNFDMSSLSWPDFIDDYVKVDIFLILLVVTLAVAGDPAVCIQGGLGYIGPGKEAHGEDVLD